MPRVLELVQQELGYNGFGTDVTYAMKRNSYNKDPTLRRLHEVFTSWNIPLLVAVRGVVLSTFPNCTLLNHSLLTLFLLFHLSEGSWKASSSSQAKEEAQDQDRGGRRRRLEANRLNEVCSQESGS